MAVTFAAWRYGGTAGIAAALIPYFSYARLQSLRDQEVPDRPFFDTGLGSCLGIRQGRFGSSHDHGTGTENANGKELHIYIYSITHSDWRVSCSLCYSMFTQTPVFLPSGFVWFKTIIALLSVAGSQQRNFTSANSNHISP